jgi:hypothetical protein
MKHANVGSDDGIDLAMRWAGGASAKNQVCTLEYYLSLGYPFIMLHT